MDKFPPAAQRDALSPFLVALGARLKALRRDENGDWRINGTSGHIYAVPGGFQIMVTSCVTMRQWNAAKKILAFAKVMQDGDTEGALFLDRLPKANEAELIRRYCGVGKRREMSEEELVRLRSFTSQHRFQPKKPASDDTAGQ